MLNENLIKIRKDRGLTQEALAAKLNVVRQTVSKWEKGLSVPDAEMLIEIADLFDTSVSALLGETLILESETDSISELSNRLSLINEQLAREKEKKRKTLKALSLFGITGSLLYFFTQLLPVLQSKLLSYSGNSSLSVIGGADGPTSIFVSSYGFDLSKIIAAALIFTISIHTYISARRKQ